MIISVFKKAYYHINLFCIVVLLPRNSLMLIFSIEAQLA